ncbi:DUF2345 domain-containing protein, partial [Variovorax sp. IB41]|uniref:DUF2345 domain-containing protein n=1 Tax=Variovorax sp. IB41 TaxID=2779370 RepID=UPI0018E7B4FA
LEANRISITAKEEILINGASSYTRWNASGIVHGTQGIWREHAATHSFAGPDSLPVAIASFDLPQVLPKKNGKFRFSV